MFIVILFYFYTTEISFFPDDFEFKFIVITAASVVRENIRTSPCNTTNYSNVTDFVKNVDVVPET